MGNSRKSTTVEAAALHNFVILMSWVIRIALKDAESLAPLRLTRGIDVAEKEAFIWVRGTSGDEKVERLVRALPAVARYEVIGGNRLRNLESRIPAETLPVLNWQPVSAWLRVQIENPPVIERSAARPGPQRGGSLQDASGHLRRLGAIVAAAARDVPRSVRWPHAALSASCESPQLGGYSVPLRIVRSAEERLVALLMTSLAEWREFALNAPEIRLRQLRFAVDEVGNVIVRGKPLPPLPGRQFVLHGNIAVRAGFIWEPAVSADVLSRRLGLATDALALFHEDGTFSRIEAEQFVPATRSAVRETAELVTR
jgi:hypothetical protein